eukprot:6409853-Pyramimonas_sp.AAC.1
MFDAGGNDIAADFCIFSLPWQASGAADFHAGRQGILRAPHGQLHLIEGFKELCVGWHAGFPYGIISVHLYAEAVGDVGAEVKDAEWSPSHMPHAKESESQTPLAYWHGKKLVDSYAKEGAARHPRVLPRERARQMSEQAAVLSLKTVPLILRRCLR